MEADYTGKMLAVFTPSAIFTGSPISNHMKFDLITTQEQFQSIREEWNILHSQSIASHVPFLRHEYLLSWWEFKGGGEWQDADLSIITARHQDSTLAGLAPLFKVSGHDDTLYFLGSIEISDFLDFIVSEKELGDFLSGLLHFLTNTSTGSLREMELYNLRDDSPSIQTLESLCAASEIPLSISKLQPSPFIPLPGDWDGYLTGIKKKQRHEIRRKIRRFENHDLPNRWYIVSDPETINTEIEHFIKLMALDSEKQEFLTRRMREQIASIARAAFDAGWLQLAFLEFDGKKIGAYMNFDYANNIWVYNSGFDPDYWNLSPGWVLLGYLIQWANQNRRSEFDFMRGDEDYKYRFGGIDRFVYRLKIG